LFPLSDFRHIHPRGWLQIGQYPTFQEKPKINKQKQKMRRRIYEFLFLEIEKKLSKNMKF
jgi:hypothetical protein